MQRRWNTWLLAVVVVVAAIMAVQVVVAGIEQALGYLSLRGLCTQLRWGQAVPDLIRPPLLLMMATIHR